MWFNFSWVLHHPIINNCFESKHTCVLRRNSGIVSHGIHLFGSKPQSIHSLYHAIALLTKTHVTYAYWGRVTHICVSELTIIASDNGLSPGRRQAIIWTNTGILLIEPYGTNFSEILIAILTFSITKMSLKVSSGIKRPSCLGLNVLKHRIEIIFRTREDWHTMFRPLGHLLGVLCDNCGGNWPWSTKYFWEAKHYSDVIMTTMASQITSLTVVY